MDFNRVNEGKKRKKSRNRNDDHSDRMCSDVDSQSSKRMKGDAEGDFSWSRRVEKADDDYVEFLGERAVVNDEEDEMKLGRSEGTTNDEVQFLGIYNSKEEKEMKGKGKKKMGRNDSIEFLGDYFSPPLDQTEKAVKGEKEKAKKKWGRNVGIASRKDDHDDDGIVISKEKFVLQPNRQREKSIKEKEKGKEGVKSTKEKEKEKKGVKSTKEKGRGKEKVNSVDGDLKRGKAKKKNGKKSGDIDDGSDKEFIEESPSSNGFGWSTGSGSGSKVGSMGGRSPGIVTTDEVASSTSKRIKESDSFVGSEESLDSDESEESRDFEDSELESCTEGDCNDSDDEDYKMNDSSSSGLVDGSSSDGSEDCDEGGKALENECEHSLVKDKNVDAEEDGGILKTKRTAKTNIGKQKGLSCCLRPHSNSKSLKKEKKQGKVGRQLCVSENGDSDSSHDEDSQGDDHMQNKLQKEKRKVENLTKMSKRKHAPGNLNVKEILLNTILENKYRLYDTLRLSEENVPKQLPLKFRFWDEDTNPPEKAEWEIEVDNLFADLQMGRLQPEIGSTTQSVVGNGNADESMACRRTGGHLRILDEQIGIICKYCSIVFAERKYVLPPFANKPSGRQGRKFFGESEHSDVAGFRLDDTARNKCASIHSVGTVWDVIPKHIKEKMYPHQREGFEFIWRNIGGDLRVEKLKELPSKGGKGCIISHAPGTGKTGLTVVFLQSFMKLFPLCCPVVIAPRSMLLTWENEFKKWDVDIPFHNLNNQRLSGRENVAEVRIFNRQPKGKEFNRMLKLYSWAKGSGILGISYRLFEKLAGGSANEGEDDKMKKILLKFPGLLVLDEGHTPRNDDSLVWKALSKVETPQRIILSGTPFQNNFHELYNTLCLVCPEFSDSSGSSRKHVRKGKAAKERWASITSSIVNNENDRKIEELKRMIAPFVHVHKGTILLEKLPGLIVTLVYLKLTDLQQKLHDMISMRNFIEQDNVMTLISVHPSLVADFCRSEVKGLELDPRAGVKTRFVFELVSLCDAHSERVIVFSRLIEPLTLIRKQLLSHFHWAENREVLYMDGKIDVKYRQDRISAFNDPESEAKVLLASTAACCEGINLIGASRIVLLDVVWNPSITRQAISRAYRLGQTKIVHVYNLISSTFEARKYACQAKKDRMSELVFSASDGNPCRTDLSGTASQDMILDAMVENQSLCHMFERLVHQPKNQQML